MEGYIHSSLAFRLHERGAKNVYAREKRGCEKSPEEHLFKSIFFPFGNFTRETERGGEMRNCFIFSSLGDVATFFRGEEMELSFF